MKISPLAAVEKKEIDSILGNPLIMLATVGENTESQTNII